LSFCHFVHFFKDEHFFKDKEAARNWAATCPGTRVITLEQGLELARMKNDGSSANGFEMAVTLSVDAPYIRRKHCESGPWACPAPIDPHSAHG
jgi:hypothetical protein